MKSARWMLSSRVTLTLLWSSRFGLILLTLFTAFTFLFLSGCRSKQQALSVTGERGAAPCGVPSYRGGKSRLEAQPENRRVGINLGTAENSPSDCAVQVVGAKGGTRTPTVLPARS